MSYSITNSYLEEVSFMFQPFLTQQGSKLMAAVRPEQVMGDIKYVRQLDVGEASWANESGGTTKYAATKYDKRRLKPRLFHCAIELEEFDMIKQGIPDAQMLAAQAANKCGKKIDEVIIQGLGGASYTESGGKKVLSGADQIASTATATAANKAQAIAEYDKTQTIAWNDCTFGGMDNQNSPYICAGLSSSKLNKAVSKLLSAENYGPLICVGSHYAMASARSDYRVASSDFNDIHSFAQGINNPYCGIAAFISCDMVDSGKSRIKPDGSMVALAANDRPDVEYAYVFAMNQIVLGSSLPIGLKNGTNAERYLNDVLIYRGAYDCTRLFEESVVRIEINKRPNSNFDAFVG